MRYRSMLPTWFADVLAGTLAASTLAACVDRTPTAPVRAPSLARAEARATPQSGKPERVPLPDFTQTGGFPAGVACDFAVAYEPVVNRLVATIFPADENGDVRQVVTGTLVLRLTNEETGESITVNISGPGTFTFHPDGSFTIESAGPWLQFDPTRTLSNSALNLTWGRVVLEVSADGSLAIFTSQRGRVEDVCAALA
jgi:hypothetical protein